MSFSYILLLYAVKSELFVESSGLMFSVLVIVVCMWVLLPCTRN